MRAQSCRSDRTGGSRLTSDEGQPTEYRCARSGSNDLLMEKVYAKSTAKDVYKEKSIFTIIESESTATNEPLRLNGIAEKISPPGFGS